MEENRKQRIAKVIAASGVCSRRDAEKLIFEGRVKVNDKKITEPATKIGDDDKIKVDDKLVNDVLENKKSKIWLFNKPAGIITSAKDEKGRKTIFDILPNNLPRVMTIGRLDYNTEGLILLTNDGELVNKLGSPKTGWIRKYKVRGFGKVAKEKLEQVEKGVEIEGIRYRPAKIRVLESQTKERKTNNWYEISIKEGKNREVRKIFEYIGIEVNRLIRLSFGPFQLGGLKAGDVKEVPAKVIREQVKL